MDRCWCWSKTFHALVNLGRKEGLLVFTLRISGFWTSQDCSKGPYKKKKQGSMKGNIIHIPMPNVLIKQIRSE